MGVFASRQFGSNPSLTIVQIGEAFIASTCHSGTLYQVNSCIFFAEFLFYQIQSKCNSCSENWVGHKECKITILKSKGFGSAGSQKDLPL